MNDAGSLFRRELSDMAPTAYMVSGKIACAPYVFALCPLEKDLRGFGSCCAPDATLLQDLPAGSCISVEELDCLVSGHGASEGRQK